MIQEVECILINVSVTQHSQYIHLFKLLLDRIDATNHLCYSPVCGTDFKYDSSSKTCLYVGTTVPKLIPHSLTLTPDAQYPTTTYITSDNQCVFTGPEHTSIQSNVCVPIHVPIPTHM